MTTSISSTSQTRPPLPHHTGSAHTQVDPATLVRNQRAVAMASSLALLQPHQLAGANVQVQRVPGGCELILHGMSAQAAELFRASLAGFADDSRIGSHPLVPRENGIGLFVPLENDQIVLSLAHAFTSVLSLCQLQGLGDDALAQPTRLRQLHPAILAMLDAADCFEFICHPGNGLLCHQIGQASGAIRRGCVLASALLEAGLSHGAIAVLLGLTKSTKQLDSQAAQLIADTLHTCLRRLTKEATAPALSSIKRLLRRGERLTQQTWTDVRHRLRNRFDEERTPSQIRKLYERGQVGDSTSELADSKAKVSALVTVFNLTVESRTAHSSRNALWALRELRSLAEAAGPGAVDAKDEFDTCCAQWLDLFEADRKELESTLRAHGYSIGPYGALTTTPDWNGQPVPLDAAHRMAQWTFFIHPNAARRLCLDVMKHLLQQAPSPDLTNTFSAVCDLLIDCAVVVPDDQGLEIVHVLGVPPPHALSAECHQLLIQCRKRLLDLSCTRPAERHASFAALHAGLLHCLGLAIEKLAATNGPAASKILWHVHQFHLNAGKHLLAAGKYNAFLREMANLCGLALVEHDDGECSLSRPLTLHEGSPGGPLLYLLGDIELADSTFIIEQCYRLGGSEAAKYVALYGDPELVALHAEAADALDPSRSPRERQELFTSIVLPLHASLKEASTREERNPLRVKIALLAKASCAALPCQLIFLDVFFVKFRGYPLPPDDAAAFLQSFLKNVAADGTLEDLRLLMRCARFITGLMFPPDFYLNAVRYVFDRYREAALSFAMEWGDANTVPTDEQDTDEILSMLIACLQSMPENGLEFYTVTRYFLARNSPETGHDFLRYCLEAGIHEIDPAGFGAACADFVQLCKTDPTRSQYWINVIATHKLPTPEHQTFGPIAAQVDVIFAAPPRANPRSRGCVIS